MRAAMRILFTDTHNVAEGAGAAALAAALQERGTACRQARRGRASPAAISTARCSAKFSPKHRPHVKDRRVRQRIEIHAFEAALVLCAVALVALVYAEGWIWPLKAAAVVLPLTLLVS